MKYAAAYFSGRKISAKVCYVYLPCSEVKYVHGHDSCYVYCFLSFAIFDYLVLNPKIIRYNCIMPKVGSFFRNITNKIHK